MRCSKNLFKLKLETTPKQNKTVYCREEMCGQTNTVIDNETVLCFTCLDI